MMARGIEDGRSKNLMRPSALHFSLTAKVTRLRVMLLTVLSTAAVQHSNATGFYGPQVYLDEGGKNILRSPEFYWDIEVKRLARNYKPIEKRIPIRNGEGQEVKPGEENTKESIDALGAELTASADSQDYAAAIKEGRIKPPNPAQATAQQETVRKFISAADDKTTEPLPE